MLPQGVTVVGGFAQSLRAARYARRMEAALREIPTDVARDRLVRRLGRLLGAGLQGRAFALRRGGAPLQPPGAAAPRRPDLQVVCRAPRRPRGDVRAAADPAFIADVLAAPTAVPARSDAFADHRRVHALREYVLVSQRERRLDVYRRDGRRWHLDEHGPGERVVLESIDVTLAVDDVYVDGLGAIVRVVAPA